MDNANMNTPRTEKRLSDVLRMLMNHAGIHYVKGRQMYGF